MDSTTVQFIALIAILTVFGLNVALSRRRQRITQRPIAAYAVLPTLVSESIEANRPLHLSLGSASIGKADTLLALAGADFLYYAARLTTIGDVSPIITVSDTASLPLAIDTLRRAYQSSGYMERFRAGNARWYPDGERSLAFAGILTAIQNHAEDDISANILAGRFGVEMALIITASQRRQKQVIAATDQIAGQAVAYALADYPLLGDEIFAASGYLDDSVSFANRNLVIDVGRFMLVLIIIIIMVFSIVQTILLDLNRP